jgi:hypothetical protein
MKHLDIDSATCETAGWYIFRRAGYIECPSCGIRVDIRNCVGIERFVDDYLPLPLKLTKQMHMIDMLGGWDHEIEKS